MSRHHPDDLIQLFNGLFLESYNTVLAYGKDEPLYLPAGLERPHHTIYFAHGFFRSALHECAHWMIAGEKRRCYEDYGYWYEPDGRSDEQQRLFERVEIKPQALEWIFSEATGIQFEVSVDNLNGSPGNSETFKNDVLQQKYRYEKYGFPPRASLFYQALLCKYNKV